LSPPGTHEPGENFDGRTDLVRANDHSLSKKKGIDMNSDSMTSESDALQRVRSVIARLVRDGKATSHYDNSAHDIFPIAASATEGRALQTWIAKEKAVNTIEIGLGYGLSALFICEALLMGGNKNAHHVVLDPYQTTGFKNCGLQFLEEAGVADMVEYCAEESQIALPRFVTKNRRFDLAFIDGSHLYDRVFLDVIYVGRLVIPGGIVFADDYQLPSVAKAISFCLKNLGWTLEETSRSDKYHQWVVLRLPQTPPPRPFPHFVDF
jgi:predicted O-methyltransferase YrrM